VGYRLGVVEQLRLQDYQFSNGFCVLADRILTASGFVTRWGIT